jgi:GGDEF domain-containing protein
MFLSPKRDSPLVGATPNATGPDFMARAQLVTDSLVQVPGLDTWLVNRIVDEDYTIIVHTTLTEIEVPTQTVELQATLCSRMLTGLVPQLAPEVLDIEPYAQAPLAVQFGIRAYLGFPLLSRSGELLGTVCGLGFAPLAPGAQAQLERLVNVLGNQVTMLGAQLDQSLAGFSHDRETDWQIAVRRRDEVTLLPDRLGWGLMLREEDARSGRYAEPVGVVVVDVGPIKTARKLRHLAEAILQASGEKVRVARIDGRQFGLLCAGLSPAAVSAIAAGATSACEQVGVHAFAGWAMRPQSGGTEQAWHDAERSVIIARRQDRSA